MKFLYLLVLLVLFFSGCSEEDISYQQVQHLVSNDVPQSQEPANLKMYMDISRSMYNYFSNNTTSDSALRSMIIKLFTKRRDLNVELTGFGREFVNIGRNEAAFNQLLNVETYNQDATIIDHPMNDIVKSTDSSTVYFIITDGVQDPKEKILSTHTLDYYINAANKNGKNFGLFVNKYLWGGAKIPSPVFIFMFWFPHHDKYVRDFISDFDGNVFINTAAQSYKTGFNVKGANLITFFQTDNMLAGQFDDPRLPIEMDFTLRKTNKHNYEKSNSGAIQYKTAVYERMLRYDDNFERFEFADNNWEISKENYVSNFEYKPEGEEEIFKGSFIKKFSANQANYTMYKVVIYASGFPGWIYDKYTASLNFDDVSRAYGLDKVFRDLEKVYNEQPMLTPSYTFYIILK